MDYVGHIYNMPHSPYNWWLYSKLMFICYTLQQKMCMAKNGFNTTTVWSVGNSEACKEYPHGVVACHLIRCVHAIFDIVLKCIATVSLRLSFSYASHRIYVYGNLELENRGHTGGLRSWNSALGRRLRVQAPGRGSFSPVATFKLCS